MYHLRIFQVNPSLQKSALIPLGVTLHGMCDSERQRYHVYSLDHLISHWLPTKVKKGIKREEGTETSSTVGQF